MPKVTPPKLIFLGSGSAFSVGTNFQSNALLKKDEHLFLIDCGSDIRHALHEQGYGAKDITDVFITHLHADHAGGLEWLALSHFFPHNKRKPRLHILSTLVDDLWNKVLAGGLNTLQGEVAKLTTYFDVNIILPNTSFEWQGIAFQPVQTVHIYDQFCIAPTYGLMITNNHFKTYFTADTQFGIYQMLTFYEMADLIFHDCETSEFYSGVHSPYEKLCTLDETIKAKMWLYHFNAPPLPDAVRDGFRGFVQKGQEFILSR
jgi:ribonuclease BN (tRNA processing enzyme)